ncbi:MULTISPECIES: DUF2065 domain-containing protein [Rhodobacterales]|uniref:DUF2065 domain-containing protein n=1 Tax=Roseobacter sp. N2S TaxID=2663844 RepID=UPI002858E747|nr:MULTISPECIES: DUF2065 domain-containing protein [Rhodobacterales]MDR6266349.1 hypothetical protein [Roseobacter sp. N2S]
MHELLLALGLMAAIEGLVLALAPLRFEELVKTLGSLSEQQKRGIGLGILAFGVVLVWIAKSF